MHYLIRQNVEPLGTGERIHVRDIVPVINLTSGRNIGAYIVRQCELSARRGRGGRCYVATGKDSPARAIYGRGFIIERIEEAGELA